MKRRDFLKIGSAATGAMLVGGAVPAEGAEKVKPASEGVGVDGYVKEPSRKIPVIASCDILVAGAGPAGFAAAGDLRRKGRRRCHIAGNEWFPWRALDRRIRLAT